jgi:hypothetical protein
VEVFLDKASKIGNKSKSKQMDLYKSKKPLFSKVKMQLTE